MSTRSRFVETCLLRGPGHLFQGLVDLDQFRPARPARAEAQELHFQGQADPGRQVLRVFQPTPGEIARIGVGEEPDTPFPCRDAGARRQLVFARQGGVK